MVSAKAKSLKVNSFLNFRPWDSRWALVLVTSSTWKQILALEFWVEAFFALALWRARVAPPVWSSIQFGS